MVPKHLAANLSSSRPENLKLAYLEQLPPKDTPTKNTLLLLHGFPQTSRQFRLVLPLLAAQGYRCIAPDYRGAGGSSKPSSDFRKTTMAADMIALLDYLGVAEPVHAVGHDVGGMIAYAMASRYPWRVRSTSIYTREKTESAVQQFHFIFHSVPDLPEALIAGKERLYVAHLLRKITYNLAAFGEADIDYYANAYAEPGAMRCALNAYRAFEKDAWENRQFLAEHGKCRVPSMVLSGAESRHRFEAKEMAAEVTEQDMLTVGEVESAGHYLAEENPTAFSEAVLGFISGHD